MSDSGHKTSQYTALGTVDGCKAFFNYKYNKHYIQFWIQDLCSGHKTFVKQDLTFKLFQYLFRECCGRHKI